MQACAFTSTRQHMYPKIRPYRASTFYIRKLDDGLFKIEIEFDDATRGFVSTGNYECLEDAVAEARKIVDTALESKPRR
jgi:hypothetical protein